MPRLELVVSILTATAGMDADAGDLKMPPKRIKLRRRTLSNEAKLLGGEPSNRERWSSVMRGLNSIQYYVTPSTGMCSPVDAFTPAWITSFYSDYSTCCKSGWAVESCLAKSPPGTPQSVPTGKPTVPQILYYPISSTGMCTPVDAYTPRWMTTADFFSDYTECCKSSWNVEPCITAQPLGSPTSSPTSEPISKPTSSFAPTSHPSLRASQDPSSEPTSALTTSSPSHNPASATNSSVYTSMPTQSPISPSPNSSCNASLWHISDDSMKCTNSFGYPVIWDSPLLSSAYLHETLSGCCEKFFGVHGNDCAHEDICGSPAISLGPTSQPSLETIPAPSSEPTALSTTPSSNISPAPSGTSFSCSSNKWHPHMINKDGCSNSLDFPEDWLGEPIYFYSSSNECCLTFFGDYDCKVYKECDDGTPTTSVTTTVIPLTTTMDDPEHSTATPESTIAAPNSTQASEITPNATKTTEAPEPTTTEAPKTTTGPPEATTEHTPLSTTPSPSSVSISHSPTISLAPTGKSLSCSTNQWHPDVTHKDGCSNSLDFPEEWIGKPMYFFNNSQDCCEFFLRDKSCKVYNICENGTLSTSLSTPTQSPLPKEIRSTCDSKFWHPSEDYSSCTNSLSYPESWDSPKLSTVYLHETAEHCCSAFFEAWNKICVIEDVCDLEQFNGTATISEETITTSTGTTPRSVTTTGGACDFDTAWHPSLDFTRCTNSNEYPESWSLPSMQEKYLFDSRERCCELFFFAQDKNCLVEDICLGTFSSTHPLTKTPTSRPTDDATKSGSSTTDPLSTIDGACDSNTWHPSSDFTGCTNSKEYPDSWNLPGMREVYLYDSKQHCCEVYFLLQDKSCPVEDSCLGTFSSIDPETKTPTKRPTGYPTAQSPTGNPTAPTQLPTNTPVSAAPATSKPSYLMPSNSPSHSPSSRPTEIKWYPDRNPDYSKGRCINSVPIPQFRETYATLRECCDSSYAGQESGACLSSEATTTLSTSLSETEPNQPRTSSTNLSRIVQYYSDPSSGMCAVVDGNTPSWITTFFIDWTECCKIGWVLDACLAAAPHFS
ncbi:hypothetical protein HJC23_005240 [Cyclotella cryptica]|uniref:Uncharacterized protein n=1 Tax=Cyclotella cryptica TaxID=29204 RepID=A0ABD3PMM6_9STRA|eukprot:CCRYP_013564-RA/>CCRYP_013564-RA protein AED:0.22 eAED:-0.13 QI:0/0/0/0.75/1/1/8/0/1057